MLSQHLRTHLIVAPSTSIGKSIFATGLCRASLSLGERVGYLKPVGTGSGDGDDEAHLQRFAPGVRTACLYHFDEPVSPHLAAQRALSRSGTSTRPRASFPTDEEFAASVSQHVSSWARDVGQHKGAMYIESAGGVHSPTLSGSSQLDAFRPLLPATILIASHELGGISTTISAYESLQLRGYDVDHVLIFREEYYRNFEYLESWFAERGIKVGIVDQPPAIDSDITIDRKNLESYYTRISSTRPKVGVSAPLQSVVTELQRIHLAKIAALQQSPRKTLDTAWWPFVQHSLVTNEKDVMVIDSAHGDFFSVFESPSVPPSPSLKTPSGKTLLPSSSSSNSSPSPSLLKQVFDGSASWWTQCLGHAHPALTLSAAHASGRYGHIIYPSATSLPSLNLATRLLETVGKSWASRVFYSDDGSTGMEVGLKMALRSFADRTGLGKKESKSLGVLGLKGSYHGDTVGAMDACEGGVFNERVEWYEGRGFWLDAPSVKIEAGKAVVRMEECDQAPSRTTTFSSLNEVYDVAHRLETDPLAEVYRHQIVSNLEKVYANTPVRFGTLILEPVVMGAGGMIFVDPLFQRVLVDLVRSDRALFPDAYPSSSPSTSPIDSTPIWRGLPIIFDEVFVGLRRLGRLNGGSFLGVQPDIACYAKILTGGLLPMAVTLASDSIFQAFWKKEKVDALLHGHSYTAHPIGCAVAGTALEVMDRLERKGAWDEAKGDWSVPRRESIIPENGEDDVALALAGAGEGGAWSLWNHSFVSTVSSLPSVEGVMALGTVLAIHLRATSDTAGYSSTASESILRQLRFGSPIAPCSPAASPAGMPFNVHARPLGNVIYFMASLNSHPKTLRAIEEALLGALIPQTTVEAE